MRIGSCLEACTYWAGQGTKGCFNPGRAEGTEHLCRGPLHRKGSGPPDRFSVCRVMTAKQHEYAKESLLIFCWKMTFKEVQEDELLKRELGFIHTMFFPKESASQNKQLSILPYTKRLSAAATAFAGQICRGWSNHLRQMWVQRTLRQSTAKHNQTLLAWRAAWPTASESSWYLTAFALAGFREQKDLKNQVRSYVSLTKDVNYMVKLSLCLAAVLPWPCAPG